MNKSTALPALVLIALFVAVPLTHARHPLHDLDVPETGDIGFEIKALNLLNALYLTPGQYVELLSLAQQAQALDRQFLIQAEDLGRRSEADYIEMRDMLRKEQPLDRDIKGRVGKSHQEFKDLVSERANAMAEIENRAVAVFSDAQLDIIADYGPCIIPPGNLSNPPRAGQAGGSEHIENILKKVHDMPDQHYLMHKQNMLDKACEHYVHHFGVVPDEQVAAERERVSEILDRVRGMSDEDFAIRLPELASEFAEPYEKDHERKYGLGLDHRGHAGTGKIGQLFLDPRIIPVLQQRAQASE